MNDKNIPMQVVKERTGLSSRQIRYYHEMGLIFPERTKGNQRLFSEEDIERLKKIRFLLEEGHTIASIKKKLKPPVPIKGNIKDYIFSVSEIQEINRLKGGHLSSLYPVSNRSYLTKILEEKDKKV